MARRRVHRQHGWRIAAIMFVVAALVAAGCGSGDDDDDGASPTTGGSTELGTGVTADEIKLGIAIIDYTAIANFVDFARGDQEKTAQIFVDYINENGGVGGRQIVPVFKKYEPIPGGKPDPLSLCTSWTEDEEVFAVLGVFIDFTGDGQLCLTREHETIHIGHELEQPWIDESPPGLMLTPDTTKDRAAQVLINLLDEEGTLEGRKVAVLADQNSEARTNDVILPGLEDIGVETGSTALLSITGTDTSAAQSQLDSFIEKWKSEDVDTVFMAGLNVSAKQFVEKIKEAMPDALLITDSSSTVQQAQDEAKAGADPNPYEGMLGTEGASASERWENKPELLQQCVDIYEDATGETVKGPDEVTKDANGKTEEIYVAVTDFCGELMMFKQIAEKVGENLNNENWTAAVDDFGAIDLPSTTQASLCKDKYAADDAFRLVEYDSSVGADGDWSPITDVIDASRGQCTS